ncbi:MAG TPA: hypothetical protein VJR05_14245 [Acidimicrobiia bacterium]|nr:hypothetical protein [Acidimicrobiia bacterium]
MLRFMAGVGLVAVTTACGGGAAVTSTTAGATTTSSTTVITTSPTSTTAAVTTSASPTTTHDHSEVPRIKVEDGAKTEGVDTLSVRVGETVRFEVEADVADEVHVHGFDLHFATVPDQEVLIEFEASAAGIFEVELEGLRLHLLDLEVTP